MSEMDDMTGMDGIGSFRTPSLAESQCTPHPHRSRWLEALECIQCARRYPLDDHPRGCPRCDAVGRRANLQCVYNDEANRPADRAHTPT
jgi:hypothetical protein